MSKPTVFESQSPHSIRKVVMLIGILLALINNYWVNSTWNGFSLNALFINALFITFLLSLLNPVLRRVSETLALRPSEMFLIYMMLAVATGAGGHDTVEMLTQTIGYPFYFATSENEWKDLFFNDLPRWLMVEDKEVLEGFYTRYLESFYEHKVFHAWLRPLLFWTAFLVALYFCMLCINLLFHKQWTERERLSYPIAQVPLGLVSPKFPLLGNRFFWYGFAAAAGLSLMNGLHRLYPRFPGPTYGKFNLGALFTERPWNAIDVVFVEFLPFVMGLAFFIPVALSLSIWFFYWFWKMEMVAGSVIGFHYLPGFPGYWTQGMGAVICLFLLSLFWSKRHLLDVVKIAFGLQNRRREGENPPYRLAILGLLLGMGFLVFFCAYAGMAPWVAVLFLGLFYVVSTVMTRMRAELGPPTHDFPFVPMGFITNVLGTKRIDASSLTQFALFKFVDYGHRSSPMPQMLESLYLKDRLNVKQTGFVVSAIIVALLLGSAVGLIGNVDRSYRSIGQNWVGNWSFNELAGQLKYHSGDTNLLYIIYMCVGGVIILALVGLSRYFLWWPFHPLGYLLGGEWMLRYLWFSIFVAWLIKWIILRFGGIDAHRKAVPFFIGIVIGDGLMLSLWNIYGNVFNKWTLGAVYW